MSQRAGLMVAVQGVGLLLQVLAGPGVKVDGKSEKALGTVESRTRTSEFYQPPTATKGKARQA